MRFGQRGSALVYSMMFAGVLGALVYNLQNFMGEQAKQNRQSVIDDAKRNFKREIEILLTYPNLCKEKVTLTETGHFDMAPMIRVGKVFERVLTIKEMTLANTVTAALGFVEADLQFVIEYQNAAAQLVTWQYARRMTFKLGESGDEFDGIPLETCLAVPEKKKECEKIGARIVGDRCSVCEMLGGVWERNECYI